MFHFFIPSLEYCLMHNVMIFWEHPVYSFRVYLFVSRVCFFLRSLHAVFIHCRFFWNLFVDFTDLSISMCLRWMHWCMHAYIIKLFKSFTHLVAVMRAPVYYGCYFKGWRTWFSPEAYSFFSSVCNMRIYTYAYVYVLKNETTDLMFALISSFMPRQIHAYALPWISKYEFCKEWTLNSGGKKEKKNGNTNKTTETQAKKVMIIREM